MMKYKKVLSIAGSDPSGGAGIQADIKTFTALGVYGGAVITCLTVQNTQKVKDSFFLPGPFVKQELDTVLEDIDIGFIKTGMIGNADIAASISSSLSGYSIICDPVMLSKSGYPLMEEKAMKAVEEQIISKSMVLTPNFHELNRLAGNNKSSPLDCAKGLLERFDLLQAVLVKGGHIDEGNHKITDSLVLKDDGKYEIINFTHPRYRTKNTHGTGCTLSSAITSFLARGNSLKKAVRLSINYIDSLVRLSRNEPIGKGNGPLPHHLGVKL
jgi:hydroxymethylpyrimidine/phosphomethylpyrimidine kinase